MAYITLANLNDYPISLSVEFRNTAEVPVTGDFRKSKPDRRQTLCMDTSCRKCQQCGYLIVNSLLLIALMILPRFLIASGLTMARVLHGEGYVLRPT